MRLPWLQLSGEGKRRAKTFGLLLGIGAHAGVGFVADLWEAALDLAPPDDWSGRFESAEMLIAQAGGLPPGSDASPSRVVQLLQTVGLVATIPYPRVRGLSRYRSTWLKNRKQKSTRPDQAAGSPSQDEDEDEDEEVIDTDLFGEPSKAKGRKSSEAQKIFNALEDWRTARCAEEQLPMGASKQPAAAKLNTLMQRVWEATGITEEPDTATRGQQLEQVFLCYLADDFGRADDRKGGALRDPPWPIELFLAPGVCGRFAKDLAADRIVPWRPAQMAEAE